VCGSHNALFLFSWLIIPDVYLSLLLLERNTDFPEARSLFPLFF